MRAVFRIAVASLPLLVVSACGRAKPASSGLDAGDVTGGVDVGGPLTDGAAADTVNAAGCPVAPAARPAGTPSWSSISGLRNTQTWYATSTAAYVAENVLYYQNANGGWPKNLDMSYRFGIDAAAVPKDPKSMIDNSATTTQIRFLAYALGSWPDCQRYADGFNNGLEYLFKAQYQTNGGWPQVWPIEASDYSRRITYNDNAMVHVMQIMRDIVYKNALFNFVDSDRVDRATAALNKGVDCMLKTQIVSGGKKTGWCAQHDEVTLLPANARAYELISQSGKEGAQVVAFLLTLDLARTDVPRQDVIDAVEAAVLFYDSVKILGINYVQGPSDAGAADSWIEEDPTAEPIWARFYDLEAPFRPFFCDRDGIKKYSLAEIGVERRGGYSWYGHDPAPLLGMTYPGWVTKWAIGRNVLGSGTPSDGGTVDSSTAPENGLGGDGPG